MTASATTGRLMQEDPAPVEPGQHPTAEQRPEGVAKHCPGRDRANRARPLRLLEEHREKPQHHRKHDRAAQPEQCARGDEGLRRRRERAGDRGHPEEQERDDQHLLAPVAVAEHPARNERGGEHQRVCGNEPLQLAGRRIQRAPERRQRDAENRAVETDRQNCEHHGHESPPLPRRHDSSLWSSACLIPVSIGHYDSLCQIVLERPIGAE